MFCWTNFKISYILELAYLFDHFLVRKMRHIMLFFIACMYTRVSQKNQKSEFCYATNPSGFHRLAEPPKKVSAL